MNAPVSVLAPGKDRAFAELMARRGLGTPPEGEVTIAGSDPFWRTPVRAGETAAAVLGAIGVAGNDIWEARTGRRQKVSVNLRHAAATLRTVDYTQRRTPDGSWETLDIPQSMKHMISVTQPWPTRDGAYFLPHLNLPHLAARVLGVLQCEFTPDAVRAAVGRWNADDLEEAIAAANACGGRIRSPEEWLAHPQGRYLSERPILEIRKIGEAPPLELKAGARPLSDVRVLDFTRILAGPICGRTLAEHGAEVLMATAPHLPQTPEHVRDTSHGKRSCFLDFSDPAQLARARELARTADVVIGGYRPGRLEAWGLDPARLAETKSRGHVHVTISCYGSGGPFGGRAGWEQVGQSVSGVAWTHGKATNNGVPKLIFATVADYLTGYLGGYGALLALGRRIREGGSWHVNVSLCQSSMFVLRQGLLDDFESDQRLTEDELADLRVVSDTGAYGRIRTLKPALVMSETPPHWATPTPIPGGDQPEWLPR